MPFLDAALSRLARTTVFDEPAAKVSETLALITHRPPVSTALGGTWLGHPVHPVLTDVPIGCWSAALLLDAMGGGRRRAARTLAGAGVLAALPTVATGLADWADTGDERRRIGTFHALANLSGTACFAVSWWLRRRKRYGAGTALALVGGVTVIGGASLGGYLVFRTGTGVDVNSFVRDPEEWTAAGEPPAPLEQVDDAVVFDAGCARILATRADGGPWRGIGARCSHRGAPLDEGWFRDDCVTCPWHRSRFRLTDGSIVDGPATAPQPRYLIRERAGTVEARAADSTR